jgi:hypothetical protein
MVAPGKERSDAARGSRSDAGDSPAGRQKVPTRRQEQGNGSAVPGLASGNVRSAASCVATSSHEAEMLVRQFFILRVDPMFSLRW